jgi:2-dehydropantoate 2-reductase
MKVLFYGAGVIGSLYAARLRAAGQNVRIPARGAGGLKRSGPTES